MPIPILASGSPTKRAGQHAGYGRSHFRNAPCSGRREGKSYGRIMRPKSLIAATCVLLVGAAVVLSISRKRDPHGDVPARAVATAIADEPAAITEPMVPRPDPPQPSLVPTTLRAFAIAPMAQHKATMEDEEQFMVQLRDLVETDPARAVAMVREGNARFATGPNAAERGWAICKALTNLKQFDAARDEAKVMVRLYPETSWARDVTKHILINPGTHPAERGYGKELELE